MSGTKRGQIKRGEEHYAWKGDAARDEVKRERAQRMYPLQPCEVCGSEKTERHHRDSNPGNNERENIAFLCRVHHMEADGRLRILTANGAAAIERVRNRAHRPCVNCGELQKRLTKGRCHACYNYLWKRGVERPDSFPSPTHCPSGHPYDEANTYVAPAGVTYCKTCNRVKAREYRAKRRSEAKA